MFLLVAAVVGAGAVLVYNHFASGSNLSPLRARIVSIAQGQLGYATDPSNTYCNKFSAYWSAGVDDCGGNGDLGEEWSADFAAWVWKEAGAVVTYQLAPGSTGDTTAPDVVKATATAGYSVVEVGNSRAYADLTGKGAPLSGYVSPSSASGPTTSS